MLHLAGVAGVKEKLKPAARDLVAGWQGTPPICLFLSYSKEEKDIVKKRGTPPLPPCQAPPDSDFKEKDALGTPARHLLIVISIASKQLPYKRHFFSTFMGPTLPPCQAPPDS